jgi:hypothetical protein
MRLDVLERADPARLVPSHITLPDKEEQKRDYSMRRLPGPAVDRLGDEGNF